MGIFEKHSKLKEIITKYIKFCIVGGIGVVINMGILWVLTEQFHLWYMLSNLIGIGVAMTSNFTLNFLWTFKRD